MIERTIVVAKSAMQIELLEQIKRLEARIFERAKKGWSTTLLQTEMKNKTTELLNLK